MAEHIIKARPGRNSSPPHHFTAAAYALLADARRLEETIQHHLPEIFHGRNYQHLPEGEQLAERQRDIQQMLDLRRAATSLRDMGNALGVIGVEHSDKN